jgi:hypothetical protein
MEKISVISRNLLESAYSYHAYRSLIDELVAQGKTTGSRQGEDMLAYTKQNLQRMSRLDKTTVLDEKLSKALQQVQTPMQWLIITEAWCGDAANNIPQLELMAAQSDFIRTAYILRDEHPEVMDAYLTNGGRSIPKLIALHADTLEELFTWGPRPAPLQAKMDAYKTSPDMPFNDFLVEVQRWYIADKSVQLQLEIETLLKGIS